MTGCGSIRRRAALEMRIAVLADADGRSALSLTPPPTPPGGGTRQWLGITERAELVPGSPRAVSERGECQRVSLVGGQACVQVGGRDAAREKKRACALPVMHAQSVTVSVTASRFYHAFGFGGKRICDAAKYPVARCRAPAGTLRPLWVASTRTGWPAARRRPRSSLGERALVF